MSGQPGEVPVSPGGHKDPRREWLAGGVYLKNTDRPIGGLDHDEDPFLQRADGDGECTAGRTGVELNRVGLIGTVPGEPLHRPTIGRDVDQRLPHEVRGKAITDERVVPTGDIA